VSRRARNRTWSIPPSGADTRAEILCSRHLLGSRGLRCGAPVDPADALASLLLTAGVAAAHIPPGLEARTALWRDRLAER